MNDFETIWHFPLIRTSAGIEVTVSQLVLTALVVVLGLVFAWYLKRLTLGLENLGLVRERALVAQEEFLSLLAREQNARMLVPSIVAALFLPLSFLTGLMSMNVAGLPGTENPWSFWLLVLLMSLTAVLIMVIFRIQKWL